MNGNAGQQIQGPHNTFSSGQRENHLSNHVSDYRIAFFLWTNYSHLIRIAVSFCTEKVLRVLSCCKLIFIYEVAG